MKATICDRCGKRCEAAIFEVEIWQINEEGKRQGSYTLKREICRKCYHALNQLIGTPDPEVRAA